jgi:hypothetical protein
MTEILLKVALNTIEEFETNYINMFSLDNQSLYMVVIICKMRVFYNTVVSPYKATHSSMKKWPFNRGYSS